MAINRAPFNLLIDDSGNNADGTPWNKNQIKTVLLDPMDAEITATKTTAFIDVPFNAANFYALAPMIWTVGASAIVRNKYAVSGKMLFWSFYLSWFSGSNVLSGSPSNTLYIAIPGGFTTATAQVLTTHYNPGTTGVPVTAGILVGTNNNPPRLELSKAPGGNFTLTDTPGLLCNLWFEIV